MIDNPNPKDWKDLQSSVSRLLSEIGLKVEIEKRIVTPRGEVEIDVWAIDKNSVDQITYVIECKNWKKAVSQTVVHSFTTVMHETGANIGFIVTKSGLQSGAKNYLKNTNIIGLTYLHFQHRYFEIWWKRFFVPTVGSIVDNLVQYIEPFNSYRDRNMENLTEAKRGEFFRLVKKYTKFGMTVAHFEFSAYSNQFDIKAPNHILDVKNRISSSLDEEYIFKSIYYRDLVIEIVNLIEKITDEFNNVFGRNLFQNDD